MLTLGSHEIDVRYRERVERCFRQHLRLAADAGSLRHFMRRRLRGFLRTGVAGSRFYSGPEHLSILGADDPGVRLTELPLLSKQQLSAMVQAAVPDEYRDHYFRAWTSGTTGVPLEMLFDRQHFVSIHANYRCLLWRHRLWPKRGSTVMMTVSVFRNVAGYSLQVPSLNDSHYERVNIHHEHWPSSRAIVEHIASARPMVLRGMPTSLELLVEHMQAVRLRGSIQPALVLTFAETLLPTTRRRLEQEFGAPVTQEYGLTEVGCVAQECPQRTGLHVNPIDFHVEILDPSTGTAVPDGNEGEIVVTNLYNRVVPLVRYRTGDIAAMDHGPCACGCVTPRITRLVGRALTRFHRPDGTLYNPFDLYGEQLLKLPVAQFQMTQIDGSRIRLSYTGDRDIEGIEAMRLLRQKVMDVHGSQAELTVCRAEAFNRERKFQAFVSLQSRSDVP
jgi:phenylacetate-CoA ligase